MELQGLKEFIDKNSQFSTTSLGTTRYDTTPPPPSNLLFRIPCVNYLSLYKVSARQQICSKGFWGSCVLTAPVLSKSSRSFSGNSTVGFTGVLGFLSWTDLQTNKLVTMFYSFSLTAEAQVYEKASLQGVQQLVHRSYQTLALWKLLCDHQVSLVINELPKVSTEFFLFIKIILI